MLLEVGIIPTTFLPAIGQKYSVLNEFWNWSFTGVTTCFEWDLDQYSRIVGKMKIRLEKPALNYFKAYGKLGNHVDKWFPNSNFIN